MPSTAAGIINALEIDRKLPTGSVSGVLLALCDAMEVSDLSDGYRPIVHARCPRTQEDLDKMFGKPMTPEQIKILESTTATTYSRDKFYKPAEMSPEGQMYLDACVSLATCAHEAGRGDVVWCGWNSVTDHHKKIKAKGELIFIMDRSR